MVYKKPTTLNRPNTPPLFLFTPRVFIWSLEACESIFTLIERYSRAVSEPRDGAVDDPVLVR
jgi:hypothetical protein